MASEGIKHLLGNHLPAFLQPWWKRLQESPLGYRLAKGTFWSLTGAAASRGLTLLASMIVARKLGKVGFGELGVLQSTVGMFGIFAGLGMGLTANKHVAQLRSKEPLRAGRIIALSSLVAWGAGILMVLLLLIFAPWVARHALNAPHLTNLLRAGSLLVLFGAVNGAQSGALSGFEAFKSLARINLYTGLLSFPITVLGVWKWGLLGALWSLIVTQGLTCWLAFRVLKRESSKAGLNVSYRGCFAEWNVLWRFSLPALFASALAGPVSWLCATVLVNQPGGYSEMGIFNAANQWFAALLFLPTILGQAVLPMLSEQVGNRDRASSARVLALAIRLNAIVVLPLIGIGCLVSPLIMASYGPQFRPAWPTLVLVLCTGGVLALAFPVGHILVAAGRMWLSALMNLTWGICCFGLTLAFVRWGAFGVAGARLIAYLLLAAWTSWFAIYFVRGSAQPDLQHQTDDKNADVTQRE